MNINRNEAGLRFSPPPRSGNFSAPTSELPKDQVELAVERDDNSANWKKAALSAGVLVAGLAGSQAAHAQPQAAVEQQMSEPDNFMTQQVSKQEDSQKMRRRDRDDSRRERRIIHRSDGTVEHRIGRNTSIDSNGVTRHRVGNTYIRSDGHTEHQVGSFRIGSDGTTTYAPDH